MMVHRNLFRTAMYSAGFLAAACGTAVFLTVALLRALALGRAAFFARRTDFFLVGLAFMLFGLAFNGKRLLLNTLLLFNPQWR